MRAMTPAVPLEVTAVGIPASGLSQQGGVTYFTVEVLPENGASYQVQKRYRDFVALKDLRKGLRKQMSASKGERLREIDRNPNGSVPFRTSFVALATSTPTSRGSTLPLARVRAWKNADMDWRGEVVEVLFQAAMQVYRQYFSRSSAISSGTSAV